MARLVAGFDMGGRISMRRKSTSACSTRSVSFTKGSLDSRDMSGRQGSLQRFKVQLGGMVTHLMALADKPWVSAS